MKHNRREAKEYARKLDHGLWGAMTTPFLPDGSLDEEGLRQLVRYCADGLHLPGVTFVGVMGEFWAYTKEERKRACEVVVEAAGDSCSTIVVTSHHSAEETIELTRHAQEVGTDGAALLPPYHPAGIDETGVYRYFKQISDATSIGLWLVDTGNGGAPLSVELTAELAKLPNIVGLKLVRGDEHYDSLVQRGVRDEIVLTDPVEDRWISLIKRGQRSSIASCFPIAYQTPNSLLMNEYTELAMRGDYEAAEAASARLQPIRDTFARIGAANPGPTAPWLKVWQEYIGVPGGGGGVRAPFGNLPEDKVAQVHAEIDAIKPLLGLA